VTRWVALDVSGERGVFAQSGTFSDSGYTQHVSWRHRIAIVVLTVLAGLPVAGTACALACDSASSAVAAHHGSGQECEEPARPSTGTQISGASGHDCSTHDAGIRQVATTAAERADVTAKSVPSVISTVQTTFETLHAVRSIFDYTAPPGTAPPTTTPFVLRV